MRISQFARSIVRAASSLYLALAVVLGGLAFATTACTAKPAVISTSQAATAIDVAGRATSIARGLQDIEIESYRFAVSTQAEQPGDDSGTALAKSQRRIAYADAHIRLQGGFKVFYTDVQDGLKIVGDLSQPAATRSARAAILIDEAERLAKALSRDLPLSDGLRARVESKVDLLSAVLLLLAK